MASIFEVNENGEIVYQHNESEVLKYGIDVNQITVSGNNLPAEIQNPQNDSQTQETGESFSSGDEYNISLLSDEVQELIVNALSPASGSLGSSTIAYFDRVVSGLPSDYKYIGYRTRSDDSYDGVLYFGDDYEIENNVITFGKDTTELRVVRETSTGYNTVTNYYESVIDGASIAYDLNGSTVYYTNAEVGYPVLGGYEIPFDYSPLISVGLLCVMALAVLQKIFLKR